MNAESYIESVAISKKTEYTRRSYLLTRLLCARYFLLWDVVLTWRQVKK